MDAFVIGLIIAVLAPIIAKHVAKNNVAKQDHATRNQVLNAADQTNVQAGSQTLDTTLWDKYTAMCKDGETLQVVCPGYKTEYYAMTDKGLIIDNKKGVQSIPFSTITSIDCWRMGGGTASSPSECHTITIYADKKYYIGRYSSQFEQIAAELMKRF